MPSSSHTAADPNPPAAADPAAVYHEPTRKRIRAYRGGQQLLDTTSAELVWEIRYYPQYYVPPDDTTPGILAPTTSPNAAADGTGQPSAVGGPSALGQPEYFDLVLSPGSDGNPPSERVSRAAWRYPNAPDPAIAELVRFDWAAADHWFEEDEEVSVHPRSPYARIDVLDASRTVEVHVNGHMIARSVRPKILYETGLPPRFYLPKTDVHLRYLTPTDTATSCPYKGTARYWSITVDDTTFPDLAWGYDTTLPESAAITGLICFYHEHQAVTVTVDGQPI